MRFGNVYMETWRSRAVARLATRALMMSTVAVLASACGDSTVVEGADLDIRIDAPFSSTDTVTASITPGDTPAYAEVAGAVACVTIDEANSFTAVNSVNGGDGGPFTLTATIVDGANETRMFTWSGTLEASQNQTLFDSDAITVDAGALEALTRIYQDGTTWQLRMQVETDTPPDLLSVRIAPRLVVNTADGGCN